MESVVADTRTQEDIEQTVRAGVLEQPTVDTLVESGVGDRLKAEGQERSGIHLQFAGERRRIDLQGLTGRRVTVYAPREVLKDLIAARLASGGDVRFGVTDVVVEGVEGDAPRLRSTEDGQPGRRLRHRRRVRRFADRHPVARA